MTLEFWDRKHIISESTNAQFDHRFSGCLPNSHRGLVPEVQSLPWRLSCAACHLWAILGYSEINGVLRTQIFVWDSTEYLHTVFLHTTSWSWAFGPFPVFEEIHASKIWLVCHCPLAASCCGFSSPRSYNSASIFGAGSVQNRTHDWHFEINWSANSLSPYWSNPRNLLCEESEYVKGLQKPKSSSCWAADMNNSDHSVPLKQCCKVWLTVQID